MGYVYVVTNPSMPGLVKIGSTDRPVSERMAELSASTGVPTPFELEIAVFLRDHEAVEAFIHDELTDRRVCESREFFRIGADTACEVVRVHQLRFLASEASTLDSAGRQALIEQFNLAWPVEGFVLAMVGLPREQLASIIEEVFSHREDVWKLVR